MELLVCAEVLSVALMYASDSRHARSLNETQKWLSACPQTVTLVSLKCRYSRALALKVHLKNV